MTREEYKAARERYRQRWATEDQRRYEEALVKLRRFVVFVAVMVIVSAAIGWVMHR